MEELRKAGLYDQMPDGVLKKDWVVNIKPVGNGQAVLKYLAPYIYRVAISDHRIESVDERGVSYRVKPSGSNVGSATGPAASSSCVASANIFCLGFSESTVLRLHQPQRQTAVGKGSLAGLAVAWLDVLAQAGHHRVDSASTRSRLPQLRE